MVEFVCRPGLETLQKSFFSHGRVLFSLCLGREIEATIATCGIQYSCRCRDSVSAPSSNLKGKRAPFANIIFR